MRWCDSPESSEQKREERERDWIYAHNLQAYAMHGEPFFVRIIQLPKPLHVMYQYWNTEVLKLHRRRVSLNLLLACLLNYFCHLLSDTRE